MVGYKVVMVSEPLTITELGINNTEFFPKNFHVNLFIQRGIIKVEND